MSAPLEQTFRLSAETDGVEKMIDALGIAAAASRDAQADFDLFAKKTTFIKEAIVGAVSELYRMRAAEESAADAADAAASAEEKAQRQAAREARSQAADEKKAARDAARETAKSERSAAVAARGKDREAAKAAKALERSAAKAAAAEEKAAQQALKAWEKAERQKAMEAENSSSAIERAAFRLRDIVAGGLIANAISSMFSKAKQMAGEAIKDAASTQHTDQAIQFQFGAENAAKIQRYIGKVTPIVPVDDDALKKSILEMGRAGVEMKDFDRNIAIAATAAAKSATPVETYTSAINLMTEATRRGSLSIKQLRGLGIGVDALKTLPVFKGLDAKAINKKLAGEGSDALTVTLQDIGRIIEGNNALLGTKGVVSANNMDIALKNLAIAPQQLYQELAKTEAFDKLAGRFRQLTEWLSPDSGPGGTAAVKFFTAIEDAGAKFIEKINWEKWGDRAVKAMEVAGKAAGGLANFLSNIAGIVDRIFGAFEKFNQIDKNLGETKLGGGIVKAIHDYTPAGFFQDLFSTGKYATQGLADGINSGAATAADAAAAMASGAHESAKKALDSHSPSRLAMELGGDYADGWGIGLSRGLDKQRSAFSADDFVGAPGFKGGTNVGGIQLSLTTVLNASGNAQEIAETQQQHLASVLPGLLTSALERLASQGGA